MINNYKRVVLLIIVFAYKPLSAYVSSTLRQAQRDINIDKKLSACLSRLLSGSLSKAGSMRFSKFNRQKVNYK